ncbi:hypothetical protein Dimus_028579, partial [Dionaea muscipula]
PKPMKRHEDRSSPLARNQALPPARGAIARRRRGRAPPPRSRGGEAFARRRPCEGEPPPPTRRKTRGSLTRPSSNVVVAGGREATVVCSGRRPYVCPQLDDTAATSPRMVAPMRIQCSPAAVSHGEEAARRSPCTPLAVTEASPSPTAAAADAEGEPPSPMRGRAVARRRPCAAHRDRCSPPAAARRLLHAQLMLAGFMQSRCSPTSCSSRAAAAPGEEGDLAPPAAHGHSPRRTSMLRALPLAHARRIRGPLRATGRRLVIAAAQPPVLVRLL